MQDYPDVHQFVEACWQGRVDIVEYWLNQEGFRPNDEFICSLAGGKASGLFVASDKGRNDVVKLLVEVGADLNQTWNGVTPLFQASQNAHTEVVQVLVKAGADLNQNWNGITPLFMASQNGHAKVVQVLVDAGADLNQTWNGATPLFQASQNGHAEVVQVLVKAGADLNQTWQGATPLFQSSQNGHIEVVQVLVKAGADLNQADYGGATPLFMASQNGRAEVVEILVKNGANPLKKCHITVLNTKRPLRAARQGQFFRLRDPEARARYASIIQTLKPAVKAWKEQKKIQAKIDGNTGCFDGFVDVMRHDVKHTLAPLMRRMSLKNTGH